MLSSGILLIWDNDKMRCKKGLTLSIRTVIVLVMAIVVFLAVLLFFSGAWNPGPIEETGEDVENVTDEEDPIGDIFNISSTSEGNTVPTQDTELPKQIHL